MIPALAATAVLTAKYSHPGDLEAKLQDRKGDYYYGWRCGNPERLYDGNDKIEKMPNGEANPYRNTKAGIQLLREGSLDHLRPADAKYNKAFSELFCASYIARYRNPNDPANPGVCVRNMDTAANELWEGILDADREAEETHKLFATKYDYQRTAAKYKKSPNPDYSAMWGSGRDGANPNNWCSAYMREMLCHVAFPQFAGDAVSNITAANRGNGAHVRPVGREKCLSMMDNCNRHQPIPYENANVTWLENMPYIEHQQDMDNSLYCDSWNRGFHIAKAGTGVAAGENEDEEAFVALWDSSSALTPIGFMAVAATLMALLQ
eukprot:TRINITY_DN8524_c0_g1_i1.p2 TRINITY_DN8524_c0_g1~~TRINITY_DN8524_c0_g1_i1.p2  ORF type:complete len:321 (+),score=145.57 TRINITY_DN8524_c0_g1_i1:60-1022(+)